MLAWALLVLWDGLATYSTLCWTKLALARHRKTLDMITSMAGHGHRHLALRLLQVWFSPISASLAGHSA
eukprot:scaffold283753_cov32-Prasinocladus_malaysianus.AAC.1